jgi:hypothetical protein
VRRAAGVAVVAVGLAIAVLLGDPARATATATRPTTAAASLATTPPARPGEGWLTGRRQRLLAVWILIDVGGALLWFGSEPARPPKLLGSVGAHRPTPPPDEEQPVRGIGRFARPRSNPPSRLL